MPIAYKNVKLIVEFFRLTDEWVCEDDFKTRKKVLISQLPQGTKDKIEETIFGRRSKTKNLRKPPRNYGPSKLT